MDVTEYFFLFTFIALGIFSLIAAILNIEWYFQTNGASLFVRRWGRKGARIFYALLGIALISCGTIGLIYW
ncbi:immunity 17 family protein [Parabacteroides pacaensis]|uniref:immunity 17 family protein n=1 Tax=Parabacteroides pacaensis TaxID=2086575 RepID=UPI000D0ECF00|nr:immunity 17 family protein [Parabacteroides pacaensis]